ncbi:sigma factor-like helix-turn-helix DNA-binding protein [Mangrovibacillus sp. Mu-81]|uniref:sigma factor-like helix-turn-helix DNA-binding protein n=1 Tax=Mangrovibacillus sp. Mu-81 TaxID=3121478 RepID=UPI003FA53040
MYYQVFLGECCCVRSNQRRNSSFYIYEKIRKIGLRKRYYNILHNKESEEYKRFISVYLNHKSMLTEREQIVLDSVYGVKGKPLKLREVAEIIEVTPERVRQLIYKSERKLVDFLRQIYKVNFFMN